MPHSRYDLEFRATDSLCSVLPCSHRNERVIGAMNDQCRHSDRAESLDT